MKTADQIAKPKAVSVGYLKATYALRFPAGHFFDRDTMRFFKSRVVNHCKELADGKIVFITSEQYRDYERKFTVRVLNSDTSIGCVDTLGEFNTMTLSEAKQKMKEYISGDYEQVYQIYATGRKVGSDGVCEKFNCKRKAKTPSDALKAVYNEYEHISNPIVYNEHSRIVMNGFDALES